MDLPLKLPRIEAEGSTSMQSKRSGHLGGGWEVRHELYSRSYGTAATVMLANLNKTNQKRVFFL